MRKHLNLREELEVKRKARAVGTFTRACAQLFSALREAVIRLIIADESHSAMLILTHQNKRIAFIYDLFHRISGSAWIQLKWPSLMVPLATLELLFQERCDIHEPMSPNVQRSMSPVCLSAFSTFLMPAFLLLSFRVPRNRSQWPGILRLYFRLQTCVELSSSCSSWLSAIQVIGA